MPRRIIVQLSVLLTLAVSLLLAADYSFPAPAALPAHDRMPGILIKPDGSLLKNTTGWEDQRTYLKAMLAHYEYGRMPPIPKGVRIEERQQTTVHGGKAIQVLGTIEVTRNGRSAKFRVGIVRPARDGVFPVIVKNDTFRFDINEIVNERQREQYLESHRDEIEEFVHEEAIRRGYVICKFIRTDVAADHKNNLDTGVLPLYPEYDWGTVAVWAWAHAVVLEALHGKPYVDVKKTAATGHSRGGKTALCAGIYDERIAVTAPNSSGTGGTGSARYFDPEQKPQILAATHKSFPYWFHPRYYSFNGQEERMPFDAHTAKALVAPRALVNAHARHDFWANPYGTYLTHLAARRVFDWLGVEENIQLHWRDGGHNQDQEDWLTLFDFCDRQFFGKKSERAFEPNPYPGKYSTEDRLPQWP
jgi:(4-O-methyl)-D-glucuronate---lignin esterase